MAAIREQDKKPRITVTAGKSYFPNRTNKENVKHLSLCYSGKIEKIPNNTPDSC